MQLPDDGEYYRERSTHAVTTCLEVLSQPGGASLQLNRAAATAELMILMTFEPGGWLQLDLTASAQLRPALESGAEFFLVGRWSGKLMRSQALRVQTWRVSGGRIECFCPYPEYFDIVQRRDTFRAELRLGMKATVTLCHEGQNWSGQLKNLSVKGCLVELPSTDQALLNMLNTTKGSPATLGKPPRFTLELSFPNGARFRVDGQLRHHVVDQDGPYLRIGLQFVAPTLQQDQQLWKFVREIERESARFIGADYSNLEPSPLFQVPQVQVSQVQVSQGG